MLYLKPVQTGGPDVDASWISRHVGSPDVLTCRTLFAWPEPVSPHLAAARGLPPKPPSAQDLGRAVLKECNATDKRSSYFDFVVVETAGGALSPSPDGSLQADVYASVFAGRPNASVLLVGDARLGGISATLCAFEALASRGLAPAAVVTFPREGESALGVADYCAARLTPAGVAVRQVGGLPADPNKPLDKKFFEQSAREFDELIARLIPSVD